MFVTTTAAIRHQTLVRDNDIVCQQSAGTLDDFLVSAYNFLKPDYPKFYKMDRLGQLGFLTAEILLRAMDIRHYPADAVSVVLSNAHASLDADTRYSDSSKYAPSPALFVYTLPNIVAGEISIRHHLKGEHAFFVTSEFDATLMTSYAEQVLRHPQSEACVAGWIDVMGVHHDVFLYLVEKKPRGLALPHTSEQLTALYQRNYGTVDGRS